MMRKRLTLLLLLLGAWAGSPGRLAAQEKKPAAVTPQTPAAVIKLKGLDGKVYDTASMRGEVLVVSFGATWCTPCTWELVAIEELKEEYAGKPVGQPSHSSPQARAFPSSSSSTGRGGTSRPCTAVCHRRFQCTRGWCARAWTRC
ncbi:MAG: redoxin family protein [Acidobacteria bacterium]|nr:redoxin family protein [Acidobacteriota bacterium]